MLNELDCWCSTSSCRLLDLYY